MYNVSTLIYVTEDKAEYALLYDEPTWVYVQGLLEERRLLEPQIINIE